MTRASALAVSGLTLDPAHGAAGVMSGGDAR
jgi:hypothetical protein